MSRRRADGLALLVCGMALVVVLGMAFMVHMVQVVPK